MHWGCFTAACCWRMEDFSEATSFSREAMRAAAEESGLSGRVESDDDDVEAEFGADVIDLGTAFESEV